MTSESRGFQPRHTRPRKNILDVVGAAWNDLGDLIQAELETIPLERGDLVVSVHACGGLTDLVLERAMAIGARVAVLPCCHDLDKADLGGLQGWLEGTLAMDVMRAERLRQAGYRVMTQQIPGDITPKNRLLMAEPDE